MVGITGDNEEREGARKTTGGALANRRLQPLGHVSGFEDQLLSLPPRQTKGETGTQLAPEDFFPGPLDDLGGLPPLVREQVTVDCQRDRLRSMPEPPRKSRACQGPKRLGRTRGNGASYGTRHAAACGFAQSFANRGTSCGTSCRATRPTQQASSSSMPCPSAMRVSSCCPRTMYTRRPNRARPAAA
jgi:hypothetical protein